MATTPTQYRDKRGVSDASLVAAVREHAQAHYNDRFGWSEIVEAWEDAEIIEAIGWADTPEGAIRKIKAIVDIRSDVFEDRMADAKNSAF